MPIYVGEDINEEILERLKRVEELLKKLLSLVKPFQDINRTYTTRERVLDGYIDCASMQV